MIPQIKDVFSIFFMLMLIFFILPPSQVMLPIYSLTAPLFFPSPFSDIQLSLVE
jgi:hypothetical protein